VSWQQSAYEGDTTSLTRDHLHEAGLTPREFTIMERRLGLYDGSVQTLAEIGRALDLTRDHIRQLEKRALSKLRHPSRFRLT
jgi:RNA polymerase primary sigma factor